MTQAAPNSSPLTIRRATPADAAVCGPICYEAFRDIAQRHGFPPDIATPAEAEQMLAFMFSTPGFFSIVAEQSGEIVGSNCMFEADTIASIGPVTVAPSAQNSSVGRRLMQAVLDRAASNKQRGIRLVQSAYHPRSLSLYAKLGFVVRETLAVLHGDPPSFSLPSAHVRPATPSDAAACNQLCREVHGHDRQHELSGVFHHRAALIVEREGRITAYTTGIGFLGHSIAKSNDDLKLLIAATPQFSGPGFLVPMRNAELLRWCLDQHLQIKFVATLMSIGLYNEPQGAWLPSIAY